MKYPIIDTSVLLPYHNYLVVGKRNNGRHDLIHQFIKDICNQRTICQIHVFDAVIKPQQISNYYHSLDLQNRMSQKDIYVYDSLKMASLEMLDNNAVCDLTDTESLVVLQNINIVEENTQFLKQLLTNAKKNRLTILIGTTVMNGSIVDKEILDCMDHIFCSYIDQPLANQLLYKNLFQSYFSDFNKFMRNYKRNTIDGGFFVVSRSDRKLYSLQKIATPNVARRMTEPIRIQNL